MFDIRHSLVGSTVDYDDAMSAFNSCVANDAKTGIAVSSAVNGDKIEVAVNIIAETAGKYGINALLVEDNIVYEQAVSGSESNGSYNHTNVLRATGVNDIFGDDLGTLNANGLASKEFSFNIVSGYVVENLSVVIYTTYEEGDGKKHIANIVKCPANGSVDFKFAE
jgi:hypothetical protein